MGHGRGALQHQGVIDILQSLTADDVANEISMTRSVFKGTYVVVEGTTDVRLYGKFKSENTKIIAACSKTNVKNAVSECRRRSDRAVIGIVDRDIDGMLGKSSQEPIFETDRHDMESTLMCTSALDGVLAEYGDAELLKRYSGVEGVRDRVGRAAAPICLLMYISRRRGMSLSFKDLDHGLFVNRKSLTTDVRRMVEEVYSHSMAQIYDAQHASDMVKELLKETEDVWDAVRGHDAVSILTIGLKNAFGAYNAKGLNDNAVSGALRLAYSEKEFAASELCKKSSAYAAKTGIPLWDLTRVP